MDFPVCEISDLDEGEAVGRDVPFQDRDVPVIVLLKNQSCLVFLNSCPHTGVRLEWRADDFLDQSNTYFQCAMHGALFKTADGMCIAGPCIGASLLRLDTTVKNGTVYLCSGQDIPNTARTLKPEN